MQGTQRRKAEGAELSAYWLYGKVGRVVPTVRGPVAQESDVDSALHRSNFRPFKPAFLYTKSPRRTHPTTSELPVILPEFGGRRDDHFRQAD